jgi:hypothetical protein
VKEGWHTGRGIIVLPLTPSNYGPTSWTDFFVDRLLGAEIPKNNGQETRMDKYKLR